MAQLKDSVVQGSIQVTNTTYTTDLIISNTTAPTIATNDYLLLADASDSNKVLKGPSLNTSNTTKWLTQAGTWTTPTASNVGLGNVTNDAQIKASVLTTKGDIIYRNDTVPTRLAIGTAGYFLKATTDGPAWANTTDITVLGTVTTGTWAATVIGAQYGGTGVNSSSTAINKVFASPASGSAGAPSFRSLVAADLPKATTSAIGGVSINTGLSVNDGAISVSYGTATGTALQGNQTLFSLNNVDITAASSASIYAPAAGGTANHILIGNGTTSSPVWTTNATLSSATSTTANTAAYDILTLGNDANVSSSTAHSEGKIYLYSAATKAHILVGTSTTTEYTHTLPNNTGLLVTLSGGTAKGSATKPIYIPNTGIVTECDTYAGGTAVTLNGTSKAANTAGFYAPTASGTANHILASGGSNTAPSWVATSIGAAYVTSANGVLTFGTLPIAQGGTGKSDDAAINTVFAGPTSGNAGAPSWRALVDADIPNLSMNKITSGTLSIANGGTGNTTFVDNRLIIPITENGTTTLKSTYTQLLETIYYDDEDETEITGVFDELIVPGIITSSSYTNYFGTIQAKSEHNHITLGAYDHHEENPAGYLANVSGTYILSRVSPWPEGDDWDTVDLDDPSTYERYLIFHKQDAPNEVYINFPHCYDETDEVELGTPCIKMVGSSAADFATTINGTVSISKSLTVGTNLIVNGTSYFGGSSSIWYINNNGQSYLYNLNIKSSNTSTSANTINFRQKGYPWSWIRAYSETGGSSSTDYQTTAATNAWIDFYWRVPYKKTSDSSYVNARLYYVQRARSSANSLAQSSYAETYYFPETAAGITANKTHYIVTTKDLFTTKSYDYSYTITVGSYVNVTGTNLGITGGVSGYTAVGAVYFSAGAATCGVVSVWPDHTGSATVMRIRSWKTGSGTETHTCEIKILYLRNSTA